MADIYQQALASAADANAFYGEQADWLSRRDVCMDKPCLVVSYNARIKDLQRWLPH